MTRRFLRGAPQSGFSLVAAIFIISVVAIIGVFIITVSGVQHSTSALAVHSARAYQAARAGVEWAAYRAITDGGCPPSAVFPAASFTLLDAGVNGFSVSVQCTATAATEGAAPPYNVYDIVSTAQSGAWGQAEFVQRRIQATITNPPPIP